MLEEVIVYINGKFLPAKEARVSPFDHGLLYGNGAWDTSCAYGGYIFKLDEHIDRLFRSAKAIGLTIPLTKQKLKEAIVETARRNNLKDAYIKFLVTRGVGRPSITAPCDKPTVIVLATPPPYKISDIEKGKRAVIVSIRQIPPMCGIEARIKQLNYLNRFLMTMEAVRQGADYALVMDVNGFVVEAATQNLFIVKNKGASAHIYTPPLESVLAGITRETIIEIVKREKYKLVEKSLTPYDLYTEDEIFITATGSGGVVPIIEVDARTIGEGIPGPITRKIRQEYFKMIQEGKHGTKIF